MNWVDLLSSVRLRVMLFIAGMLLLISFFYVFIIQSQQQQLAQLETTALQERQRVRLFEGFLRDHPDYPSYLQDLDAKFDEKKEALPDSPNISGFLLQLQQIAGESGVSLLSIKPEQTTNQSAYRETPVSITVRGSYLQTLQFLKKLEDGVRVANIGNYAVKSYQGSILLDATVTFSIFSFGTSPDAAAPAANNPQGNNSPQQPATQPASRP